MEVPEAICETPPGRDTNPMATAKERRLAKTYGGRPKLKTQKRRYQKPPRDLTGDMFPTVAVENQAQNKLFKLANQISGFEDDRSEDRRKSK